MTTRTDFVKTELEKIYNNLSLSNDYGVDSKLEDDSQFKRIFELIMELSEKLHNPKQVVMGSFV